MTMHKLFRNNSYFNFLRFFSFPLSLPFSFKQFTVNQTFITNRTLINNYRKICFHCNIFWHVYYISIPLYKLLHHITKLCMRFVRIIAKVFPQISRWLSHINIAAIQILNYKGYSLISFFKLEFISFLKNRGGRSKQLQSFQ